MSKLESEDGGRALLYFVSPELNEAQDRYESQQRKIASKSAEIDLLLSRERNRYAAALWRRLAHYMVRMAV